MKVTGYMYTSPYVQYFVVQSVTPIDGTGNSISGESESAQELFYNTFDQSLFGANRSIPTAVNEPDSYAASFINSNDEEVVPGIGYALILMGINQGSIPTGTVITVTFSDGTTAQYVKASPTATYQWTWNGTAHNKKGQLIDRAGGLIQNPNTAGLGSGVVTAPGFNPGGVDWNWVLNNLNECYVTVTADVSGESIDLGGFTIPC
ncbi:MAG TPA: hypothetical protein VME42_02235 [Steroidobacteraceae bacterium]|nr:hypothetical protein [Steroidobacteraceae bacterium]